MHINEKKHEIVRLAEMIGRRPEGGQRGHRIGRLHVQSTDGGRGLVLRLYPSVEDNGWSFETVYARARDYAAEETSINNEMAQMGINMKGGRKIYNETDWVPARADEVLSILQQATVLDQLADL